MKHLASFCGILLALLRMYSAFGVTQDIAWCGNAMRWFALLTVLSLPFLIIGMVGVHGKPSQPQWHTYGKRVFYVVGMVFSVACLVYAGWFWVPAILTIHLLGMLIFMSVNDSRWEELHAVKNGGNAS